LHYERIIAAEESFLEGKFGETYTRWADKTPIFFPKFTEFVPNTPPFYYFYAFYQEKAAIAASALSFWFIAFLRGEGGELWIKIALIFATIYYAAFYIAGKIIKKKRKDLRSR
jgi:hypothetical protein